MLYFIVFSGNVECSACFYIDKNYKFICDKLKENIFLKIINNRLNWVFISKNRTKVGFYMSLIFFIVGKYRIK